MTQRRAEDFLQDMINYADDATSFVDELVTNFQAQAQAKVAEKQTPHSFG
jgi:uncharacterized protein with HEPN domain